MGKATSVIKGSLQESFLTIKKHKLVFIILFIMQIIFFSLIFFVNIKYQSKMLESTQAIIEYLDKQKFDESSIGLDILQQKNPLSS